MKVLIFDMDGVLVEVTDSYRQATIETIEQFGGPRLTNEDIQDYKNQGGFNNDWDLCAAAIRKAGITAEYSRIVDVFQRLYLGENNDGLILRETWIPSPGLLERLAARYRLALFTGRLRAEAFLALDRLAPELRLDPLVGMEDVERHKPDPEGLRKICAALPGADAVYVGDTIDDCVAARAAGVRFIGIVAPALPHRDKLTAQFQRGGAAAVIPDVNHLEGVL